MFSSSQKMRLQYAVAKNIHLWDDIFGSAYASVSQYFPLLLAKKYFFTALTRTEARGNLRENVGEQCKSL